MDLVLATGERERRLERPRLPGPGLRGSGCRHATALAVGLAAGRPLLEAAERAAGFVAERVAGAG